MLCICVLYCTSFTALKVHFAANRVVLLDASLFAAKVDIWKSSVPGNPVVTICSQNPNLLTVEEDFHCGVSNQSTSKAEHLLFLLRFRMNSVVKYACLLTQLSCRTLTNLFLW